MTSDEARRRFAEASVARLATSDGAGHPHLVPIVFASYGDTLVTAVDNKPKRTTALRRLANIAENPHVAVLVDHYTEDWNHLWWVRADGLAKVLTPDNQEFTDALDRLVSRYAQYQHHRPPGPVIKVEVHHWSGWSAAESDPGI